MSLIPGSVGLTGFIAPTDSTDVFAVTKPIYGLGGLRTVSGMTELSAITSQRREVGMIVYVSGTSQYYKLESGLTNSDWVLLNLTGGTGSGNSFSGWTSSTGTNSIIANNGTGTVASGTGGIAGGFANNAYGYQSVAMAGKQNFAQGGYASILGGRYNTAYNDNAFVGGGQFNLASGINTAVVGGNRNSATTAHSSIVGGKNNFISGYSTYVSYSFIGGGENNTIGNYASHSFIGGGRNNLALGYKSFIGAGYGNSALTNYTTIVGGRSNLASNSYSFIGAGFGNIAYGSRSSVVGGSYNSATTNFSTIVGGRSNLTTGYQSFIGAGQYNTASGFRSLVVGGLNNTASNDLSSVLGGTNNKASGIRSAVLGGQGITGTSNDTVYVPFLNIQSALTSNTIVNVLVKDVNGNILTRDISSLSGTGGNFIPMSGTGANLVTGDVTFDDSVNIAWTTGSDFLQYNPGTTNVELNTSNGFDLVTGAMMSAGTDLYNIFGTGTGSGFSGWTSSTGVNSIIANNGTLNIASNDFVIIGGNSNSGTGIYSTVINGTINLASGNGSFIANGSGQTASGARSFIGAGSQNTASGAGASVLGGQQNVASGPRSSVMGGIQNIASGNSSSVLAGSGNTVSGLRSSILGGQNISGTSNDTAYVPFLNIKSANTNNVLTNILVRDINGDIYLRDASTLSGSGSTGNFIPMSGTGLSAVTGDISIDDSVNLSWNAGNETLQYNPGSTNVELTTSNGFDLTSGIMMSAGTDLYNIFLTTASTISIQNGLNTYTGGTALLPTVNVSAATLSYLSATTISGGTIYSGNTNLESIFVKGSGTVGTLPLWDGTTYLGDSLITQTGTGVTVSGSVQIYGNVSVLGTATTFNTQTIQTEANIISLNLSGAHLTSLGGGIQVLSGTPNGIASTWTIDSNGAWSANTGIFTTAITVNGGAIISGGTDLYNIFLTSALSGTSGNLWSSSTGSNSIIANNGTGNIANAISSVVFGVNNQSLSTSNRSFIGGGQNHTISGGTNSNLFILGGQTNLIGTSLGSNSGIIGGISHVISGSGILNNVIVGGNTSIISFSRNSIILGGEKNNILSSASTFGYNSIIAGSGNTIAGHVNMSAIIGGNGISAVTSNTVYVPFLNIKSANTNNVLTNILVRDINGDIYLRDASTLSGSGSTGGFSGWTSSTGSNSIIANNGSGNIAIGVGSFAGGQSNSALTNYSIVLFGTQNISSGYAGNSIVVAGTLNSSLNQYSTIINGQNNVASGLASFIGNGQGNIASGYFSFIGNGIQNSGTGIYTTVIGGKYNLASGNYSSIIGGQNNLVSGNAAFVGAGSNNIASGIFSNIVGGYNNKATALYSTLGGGQNNTASGLHSSIVGGNANNASGVRSFIGGGQSNTASTNYAVVVGGQNNTASGARSFIGGGRLNAASGAYSSIVNGKQNTTSAISSSVLGGTGHTVSAINSAIIGGRNITATSADTVYVPFLNVNSASTNNVLTNVLVRDTNGYIYLRDASTLSGSSSTGNALPLSGGTVTGDTVFTAGLSATTTTQASLNVNIFGASPVVNNGDVWFTQSGASVYLNVNYLGNIKTVELT